MHAIARCPLVCRPFVPLSSERTNAFNEWSERGMDGWKEGRTDGEPARKLLDGRRKERMDGYMHEGKEGKKPGRNQGNEG